ncbi:unnamed protein product, partial [Amoebophrya sp. A25]
ARASTLDGNVIDTQARAQTQSDRLLSGPLAHDDREQSKSMGQELVQLTKEIPVGGDGPKAVGKPPGRTRALSLSVRATTSSSSR